MGWHRASTKFGFRFRRAKMLVEVRDGSARTAKWSGPALSVWRRAALALLGIHRWPAVPRDHCEDDLVLAKQAAEDWFLALRGKSKAGLLTKEKTFRKANPSVAYDTLILTRI